MEVFEYVIHDEGWESSSVISLNEGSKIPQNAVEVIYFTALWCQFHKYLT